MSKKRSSMRYALVGVLFLSLMLVFGGCVTAVRTEKAQIIKTGAAQYQAEALGAIDKIDELRQKELEVPPISPEQASAKFVTLVKNSEGNISLSQLNMFLNPVNSNMPTSGKQWQIFLQKVRDQYTTFNATFTSLDQSGFLALSDVKRTVPVLDKLIAQLVAFSSVLAEHPVTFISDRVTIVMELEDIRDDVSMDPTIRDMRLLDIENQLRDLVAAEVEMTSGAMAQALKAATVGMELRKILINYEHVSLNEIAQSLSVAFSLAGSISGMDFTELEAKTSTLINEINADPELKSFFELAISDIM